MLSTWPLMVHLVPMYRETMRSGTNCSTTAAIVLAQVMCSASTLPLRRITRVALYDVSPVTYPAYAETSVSARDLPSAIEAAAAVVAHQQALEAVQARQRWVAWRERGLHPWVGRRPTAGPGRERKAIGVSREES